MAVCSKYRYTRYTGPSGPLHLTAWFFWPKANLAHRPSAHAVSARRECIRECIRERIRLRNREAILEDERSTERRTTGILRV
jgi:hypothetical protein